MSKTNKIILRMTTCAIFGAFAFVLTAFLQIPYPTGAGYFNFGDVLIVLTSIFVGPLEGVIVGLIGGALADLFSGYIFFVPFTIIAKTLLALISGLGYKLIKKKIHYIFPFIGAIFMAITYMFAYFIINENFNTSYLALFDLLQGVICALSAVAIDKLLRRSNIHRLYEFD